MKDIKLSVIIVSYKNQKVLSDCLNSIYAMNDIGESLEIIVVENSPTDIIYSHLKENYPDVISIKNENKGFGQGNNVGMKHSNGAYLLFLNPDTVLTEPIFSFALQKFFENKYLGLFGLKLLDENRNRNISFFWIDKPGFIGALTIKVANKFDLYKDGRMFISGANMFTRKRAFIDAGLFDEKIFLYCEEADLTKRIQKVGFSTGYFKEKSIIHLEGGASETTTQSFKFRMEAKKYYSRKYSLNYKKLLKAERRHYYLMYLVKKSFRNQKSKIYLRNIKLLNAYINKN